MDFMVKEPTANLFTVPNSLTELSSSAVIGRFVRSSLFVHDKVREQARRSGRFVCANPK